MKPNNAITALPWHVSGDMIVSGSGNVAETCKLDRFMNGSRGASDAERMREANAEYIVRACNAVPACIEAMEQAEIGLCNVVPIPGHEAIPQDALRAARAALALARGEKGKP